MQQLHSSCLAQLSRIFLLLWPQYQFQDSKWSIARLLLHQATQPYCLSHPKWTQHLPLLVQHLIPIPPWLLNNQHLPAFGFSETMFTILLRSPTQKYCSFLVLAYATASQRLYHFILRYLHLHTTIADPSLVVTAKLPQRIVDRLMLCCFDSIPHLLQQHLCPMLVPTATPATSSTFASQHHL